MAKAERASELTMSVMQHQETRATLVKAGKMVIALQHLGGPPLSVLSKEAAQGIVIPQVATSSDGAAEREASAVLPSSTTQRSGTAEGAPITTALPASRSLPPSLSWSGAGAAHPADGHLLAQRVAKPGAEVRPPLDASREPRSAPDLDVQAGETVAKAVAVEAVAQVVAAEAAPAVAEVRLAKDVETVPAVELPGVSALEAPSSSSPNASSASKAPPPSPNMLERLSSSISGLFSADFSAERDPAPSSLHAGPVRV